MIDATSDTADPHATDPPLLANNSKFKSYKTSLFEYPEIRVFFRQHAKASEFPAVLPLLAFIPGLGGSVAQFHPLLTSLVDLAPCMAIDFPGAGRSKFAPTCWEAYTPEALLQLLESAIEDHRDAEAGQSVVLLGHSMGTTFAAWLANKHVPHTTALTHHVTGLVAICPLSGPWDQIQSSLSRTLLWLPDWVFALWRAWDNWGGNQSRSVTRFVGRDAEPELKLLQSRFNRQSRTPVWRRMAYGSLPTYKSGRAVGGIPGLQVWAGLDIPLYLIAGKDDHITPPEEVDKIVEALRSRRSIELDGSTTDPVDVSVDKSPNIASDDGATESVAASTSSCPSPPPQPQRPPMVVKTLLMPAPANHALLYMPRISRALAGLISDFLATDVSQRLSLAWQLQYLSREGKWDVKNLVKWKSVEPVSALIACRDKPVFRAMKTLREADDAHCPAAFVEQWGAIVKDVIDISQDQPVYDPRGLERAGVHYHKFPTVSKVPPQANEVEAFIQLVDRIRDDQKRRAAAEMWRDGDEIVIGVHCHYGFNRTGYFIVCYLVERCGLGVPEAIDLFARQRPPGIRHSHFLDRLYVRYNIEERPREDGRPQ